MLQRIVDKTARLVCGSNQKGEFVSIFYLTMVCDAPMAGHYWTIAGALNQPRNMHAAGGAVVLALIRNLPEELGVMI